MHRLAAAVAAIAIAAPSPALALSCAWGPTHVLPPPGTVEVPTNAVLRVTYLSASPDEVPFVLVDPTGEAVEAVWAIARGSDGGETVWTVTPSAPLDPATTYRLVGGDGGGELSEWTLTTFTTGTGPQTEGPAAPEVLDARRDAGRSEWGPWRYHQLVVTPAAAPVYYEVDVASDREFGAVRTVQVPPWADGDAHIVGVGVGLCGGNVDLERGDRWLRARAIDMAGNISTTSAADRAGGCSTVASPASGAAFLLAFGLGAVRRRPHGRR
jgi:hypothetical protein